MGTSIVHSSDPEKERIQAQHRLEEAQNRDRKAERNARTRRLIQEGAILEKVFPWTGSISDLSELEAKLCEISEKTAVS